MMKTTNKSKFNGDLSTGVRAILMVVAICMIIAGIIALLPLILPLMWAAAVCIITVVVLLVFLKTLGWTINTITGKKGGK